MTAPPTPQIYTVQFTPGLAGDYNDDNQVDTADYVVWRYTLGQSGTGLAADGDHDGTVGEGDYNVWTANFGVVGQAAGAVTYAGGQAASTLSPSAIATSSAFELPALLPAISSIPTGVGVRRAPTNLAPATTTDLALVLLDRSPTQKVPDSVATDRPGVGEESRRENTSFEPLEAVFEAYALRTRLGRSAR